MNLPDIKTGGKSAILANDANQWTRAIKELDARVGTLQKENRLFEDATRFIKYNSDTDSQAYSVVQIGSLILDDGIDARTLKLTNGYKVNLSRGYIDFGITGPSGILANSTGKVLTSGTTAVRINIQSVYHNYADIEHDSESLISGWQGRARILWKASATIGEQWCIIEFPTTDWVWVGAKPASYTIPPYSFSRIFLVQFNNATRRPVYSVDRPDADGLPPYNLVVSGPSQIQVGQTGPTILSGAPHMITRDTDTSANYGFLGTTRDKAYATYGNYGYRGIYNYNEYVLITPDITGPKLVKAVSDASGGTISMADVYANGNTVAGTTRDYIVIPGGFE